MGATRPWSWRLSDGPSCRGAESREHYHAERRILGRRWRTAASARGACAVQRDLCCNRQAHPRSPAEEPRLAGGIAAARASRIVRSRFPTESPRRVRRDGGGKYHVLSGHQSNDSRPVRPRNCIELFARADRPIAAVHESTFGTKRTFKCLPAMSAFDPKRVYRAPLRRVIKRPTLRSVGYCIDQRYPSFRLQWNLPYTEGMISPSSSSARVAKASIF
jgi:hypothetical protein